ncbi:hypothetical protein Cabther_B0379 [Chloracidobacterium thermophilum B]|jgi:hypothetical protein|uniref:HNH endonuclease n=1 Tax=Chloracidobacterium thermophilum (strain B) TaxID=981222 RepID=G2LLA6_CHLTF|nr:hypothetical protein Cabther_B0379 [Chloracidobacterium thermophilum B]
MFGWVWAGDLVRVVVTTGKKAGNYLGRVAIRASGSFNIQSATGLVQGIHHRCCTLLQRADGYGYSWTMKSGLAQTLPVTQDERYAPLSLPSVAI